LFNFKNATFKKVITSIKANIDNWCWLSHDLVYFDLKAQTHGANNNNIVQFKV